jgi:prephenate dehydratase
MYGDPETETQRVGSLRPSGMELVQVNKLHTLGPHPTNCEMAAKHWFTARNRAAHIELHETLEVAAERVVAEPDSALLACVVYPKLNDLVFRYLGRLALADLFIVPTFAMVVAQRRIGEEPTSIASHPAPAALIPEHFSERFFANSNAHAAELCAAGKVDACVTTIASAKLLGLAVVEDFGEVPMGFSLHVRVSRGVVRA